MRSVCEAERVQRDDGAARIKSSERKEDQSSGVNFEVRVQEGNDNTRIDRTTVDGETALVKRKNHGPTRKV